MNNKHEKVFNLLSVQIYAIYSWKLTIFTCRNNKSQRKKKKIVPRAGKEPRGGNDIYRTL